MKRFGITSLGLFLCAALAQTASAQEVDTVTYSSGHPIATHSTDPNTLQMEADMLDLINQHRVSIGRSAFLDDPNLKMIARGKSKHMHVHSFFAHDNPEGDDPFRCMQLAGLSNLDTPGEILARNTYSAGETAYVAFYNWILSDNHRPIVEHSQMRKAGVGYAVSNGMHHWSMEAAKSYTGSVATPPPAYTDLRGQIYGARNRYFDSILPQQVLVTNTGGFAPSSRMRIYYSTDRYYSSNDELLSSYSVPSLSNGETFLLHYIVSTPLNSPKIGYVLIRLDYDNDVSETNESNNLVVADIGRSRNPYDINGDGPTDLANDIMGAILAAISMPGQYNWNPQVDYNGDNFINLLDILDVILAFGTNESNY